jgi:AcrR family transcriptional regulator
MARDVKTPEKSRGRPRSFDRDAALAAAMQVFWRRGYDGASMAELTGEMGINAPSLYAAFGSKEGLFQEALRLYLEVEELRGTKPAVRRADRARRVARDAAAQRPLAHARELAAWLHVDPGR